MSIIFHLLHKNPSRQCRKSSFRFRRTILIAGQLLLPPFSPEGHACHLHVVPPPSPCRREAAAYSSSFIAKFSTIAQPSSSSHPRFNAYRCHPKPPSLRKPPHRCHDRTIFRPPSSSSHRQHQSATSIAATEKPRLCCLCSHHRLRVSPKNQRKPNEHSKTQSLPTIARRSRCYLLQASIQNGHLELFLHSSGSGNVGGSPFPNYEP
ncbi:hypothetical protein LR48_Vigan07g148200 [Vigna angularis]|uniref:Uncharacterized protein n=1 Tax=Phaseolus angularis TaxID=3914 RepID=A0A0L9UYB9_PHAAN|nr:hypothetical protein LR48_Vigan07g148200 [Vigna angularis]